MLEKPENQSLGPWNIDLMCIDKPQTPHKVEHVKTAVKGIEDSLVDKFEIPPVSSEVVVGVRQRVDDELHGDADNHHDAQHRRPLFHRIVIFEDEPLRPYAHADRHHYQHESYWEVDFAFDGLAIAQIVLASAKQLIAIHYYYWKDSLEILRSLGGFIVGFYESIR